MIAVIADDFTGAAEIGGVGLRYGLKVVIETSVHKQKEADLLVIATNSRSLSQEKAMRRMKNITRKVLELNPEFIFKKMDSVLRGNIAAEIRAQLSAEGKRKAILVPGNPALGRIIKDGLYYVNGIPLHETFFAGVTDFPADSSSVEEIIGRGEVEIFSRRISDPLPESGIIVGDVSSQDELDTWARKIDSEVLAAGGAGFFNVILSGFYTHREKISKETYQLTGRSLLVMGSRYPKDQKMNGRIKGNGMLRMNMPEAIYRDKDFDPGLLEEWAAEIIRNLDKDRKIVISIDHESHDEAGLSKRLRRNIGKLVRMIMDRTPIDNLLIEGGATTYEILKNLGIKKLYPYRELGLGIIQMRVDRYPGLCITTKPGSYSWPDNVEFVNTEQRA